MSNLLQRGIVEQDITNINQLVENVTTKDIIDKSNNRISASKSEYWKKLIEELKKYENLKIAIIEQQKIHNKFQEQINQLDEKKQETLKYLQIAISIINTINNQIYYYKGYIDQFNKDLNYYKSNVSVRPSRPLIFIVNKDSEIDKDDDNNINKKGKDNPDDVL